MFGKQAESCAQFLRKGSIAHVEGRIQTRSYDKDGVTQYRTEIVGDRIQFGPRPPKGDVAAEGDMDQRPPSERAPEEPAASDTGIGYPDEDIDISAIPF